MDGEKLAIIGLPLLAVLFVAIGFIAKPPAEPEPEPAPPQAFDKELAAAYVQAGCWQCHAVSTLQTELTEAFGEQAAGARPMGPDLAGVGNRYHPDWHTAHFWKPDDVYAGSQMPAQRQLFEPGQTKLNAQGRKVVEFLLTLKSRSDLNKPWPTARVTAPTGDAERGRLLFLRECAGCHGRDADGDGPAARFMVALRKPPALAKGDFIYMPAGERPLDSIYTVITNGVPGSAMPSFASRLTEQQRADLAAWVAKVGGK
ncbi:MAG: c-type cytochrome [Planctomycetes bacterium]|nr:c-type cytochrome [Planctomycetota bacterium]MCB9936598.1 c-type cytochrome [Planctomycetota bacterium]